MSGSSIILTHPRKHIFRAGSLFNISCGIIVNHLIGPFVLEERLTSKRYVRFLENECCQMFRSNQARSVSAARWRNCISQSTFSKPLNWTAESGCLATDVT
jgi:hypothetical protein